MAGQIIRRGTATWLVRISRGRGANGTRLYHSKTVKGSRQDAERYRTKILRELDTGEFVQASKRTVGELLNEWLAVAVKPRVRRRTHDDYTRIARADLIPQLGHRPLSRLAASEIQGLYAAMTGRGVSPRSVRYTHAVLSGALKQAVRWRWIARSPASLVSLPRQSHREMRALDDAQARRFVDAATGDTFGALWVLLITTGLRPSEALALRWSDIEAGRLHVQRGLTRHPDGSFEFNEPKTARGRRAVTLPQSTTVALRDHRQRQLSDRLRAGAAWTDRDLVFSTAAGEPLDFRALVRRHFKKLLRLADVPTIRPYDLRHTCATLLLKAGQNPRIVSERLGHENVSLTLDTYSHVLPDMQEEAAEHLERILFAQTTRPAVPTLLFPSAAVTT